eukprot:TRINITY_DN92147_c0_g1_i1.p1 TRINITY_DN92147_c0_g1~~TRINITY_DN92147_c0_g1_i1.p1  ORF type:complete len:577 (-),score=122.93 TRINITY_DN92147_c0_g1_i1:80-1783(-)
MDSVPILAKLKAHASASIACAAVDLGKGVTPAQVSYAELLRIVSSIAPTISQLLEARPAELPRHVAYLVNPSIAYVVTELAVWAAGGCCVPLSVHSPSPELEYFVQDSESCVCIADASMESKMKPVAEKLGRVFANVIQASSSPPAYELKVEHAALARVAKPSEEPGCFACLGRGKFCGLLSGDQDESALILYTSGTTGKPKGVVHTHRSLTAQYESLSEAWKWSSKDRTLHVLPLHHIHGVQNILNTALFNGAAVELTPFDAEFCMNRLASGEITCFHAVPTIYVKFTQHLDKLDAASREKFCTGFRNPNLRYMVSGSAALPVPTMKSWAEISGHVLLERYGMTEIGMALSNKLEGTRFPGCVGWPLPQVQVKIDEDGGVLVKGGPVFKEYYKKPDATAKEFTADGWFRTGDNVSVGGTEEERQAIQDGAREVEKATGRPLPDTSVAPDPSLANIYKILGRSSVDIIKSGGYKISGLEIESVLLQHPKIRECAVVGKPDETWGEKVTAVCVLESGQTLAIKELRDWGKERLASYKVPQEIEAVDELPRNQMGKLEKKKILERYQPK